MDSPSNPMKPRLKFCLIKQQETLLMVLKSLFTAMLLLIPFLLILVTCTSIPNDNPFSKNTSFLTFNANAIDCGFGTSDVQNKATDKSVVKLPLKRRTSDESEKKISILKYTLRDSNRIHTFRRRILENTNQNSVSRLNTHRHLLEEPDLSPSPSPFGHLIGNLKSGVSLGSGEYFIDVFIGTPPKHFLLILDTGSDLNWIQCIPCYDCFEQDGPHYDPNLSTSFEKITCKDPRCDLVSPPDTSRPCTRNDQTCPYFYWYGDRSNTTGDFSLEKFTVNLTDFGGKSKFKAVENVMFGCGHWNRGLFHGAAGLLGLGRGPLSFSSQLKSLYGHSFSYCLVDWNSDADVSGKLIFGEDKELMANPELSFTNLLNGKETFYYVEIKEISVGGEILKIPKKTWDFTEDGEGGTIIDSGTTLSYFVSPAYEVIKDAFMKKIKKYTLVTDFDVLKPCYNVSGVKKLEMPSFKIRFTDGAEWNFPIQNYFIWIDQDVACLALMPQLKSGFSIIGNYQQQNFHVLYDTKASKLGFAPRNCADI